MLSSTVASEDLAPQVILRAMKVYGIPGSMTPDALVAINKQLWRERNKEEALAIILQAIRDYLERNMREFLTRGARGWNSARVHAPSPQRTTQ